MHPCIYCRHSHWTHVPSRSIDQPVFSSCSLALVPPSDASPTTNKCPELAEFSVSVKRIINKSLKRCGGTGFPPPYSALL
jgi:hypothetical protein